MWPFVALVLAIVALTGCRGERAAQTATAGATQTIAPASAPPAPNGSDAMTQTVDVEDSRSEAEGGTLTSSGGTPSSVTTATAATTSFPPKPPRPPKAPAKKKP